MHRLGNILSVPSRDRKYLHRWIRAVSGRIFFGGRISPNVYTASDGICEGPNFPRTGNNRSLNARGSERACYRTATARERYHERGTFAHARRGPGSVVYVDALVWFRLRRVRESVPWERLQPSGTMGLELAARNRKNVTEPRPQGSVRTGQCPTKLLTSTLAVRSATPTQLQWIFPPC